jgi:hypothetical protein
MILEVLGEYQEHITRAQNYKPTSDRGEAVSPLLRALERVVLLLKDDEQRAGKTAMDSAQSSTDS